jgi:hypothetical protein
MKSAQTETSKQTVHLSLTTLHRLKICAAVEGRTQGECIAAAVEQYLDGKRIAAPITTPMSAPTLLTEATEVMGEPLAIDTIGNPPITVTNEGHFDSLLSLLVMEAQGAEGRTMSRVMNDHTVMVQKGRYYVDGKLIKKADIWSFIGNSEV